jgi:hypothetical protein
MACYLLGAFNGSTARSWRATDELLKFVNSSSTRDATATSILGYLLYCRRYSRTGLRRCWSTTAKIAGTLFEGLYVISLVLRGTLSGGWM